MKLKSASSKVIKRNAFPPRCVVSLQRERPQTFGETKKLGRFKRGNGHFYGELNDFFYGHAKNCERGY